MAAAGPDADGAKRIGPHAAGVVVLGARAARPLVTAAAPGGRPEGMLLAVPAVAAGHAAVRIGGACCRWPTGSCGGGGGPSVRTRHPVLRATFRYRDPAPYRDRPPQCFVSGLRGRRRSRMTVTAASASSTVTVKVWPSQRRRTTPSPRRTTTAVPFSGRQRYPQPPQ